ncbi:MAG: ribonuclease domain-containing protein [Erysipelotrichaceae bacterium]|nr:ribonuclease domain-containing protein [Erysipelotrichaceae bacterium]
MDKRFKLLFVLLIFVFGIFTYSHLNDQIETVNVYKIEVVEDKAYTKLEEVVYYLYTFDKLPNNYLTKNEAMSLGWISSEGNLWKVTDMKSIGGDIFYNRERQLPNADQRVWYECDINYQGGFRNAERLVYSNDGLFYYTDDHYDTFTEITIKE